jgi:hypothetical protein
MLQLSSFKANKIRLAPGQLIYSKTQIKASFLTQNVINSAESSRNTDLAHPVLRVCKYVIFFSRSVNTHKHVR